MNETTEWATIGKIVAPFGIRGDLKIRPCTDIPDRFVTLEAVYLSPDYVRRVIQDVHPYKGDMLLLKLKGINDATTAETLRGIDLCIPVDALAKLPPDAYYQHDIVGLRVLLLDSQFVGVISDIMVTGSNDVYVIKADDGRQFLIPAVKDIIKRIDLDQRMMYIDPIKGLLGDDAVIADSIEKEDSR